MDEGLCWLQRDICCLLAYTIFTKLITTFQLTVTHYFGTLPLSTTDHNTTYLLCYPWTFLLINENERHSIHPFPNFTTQQQIVTFFFLLPLLSIGVLSLRLLLRKPPGRPLVGNLIYRPHLVIAAIFAYIGQYYWVYSSCASLCTGDDGFKSSQDEISSVAMVVPLVYEMCCIFNEILKEFRRAEKSKVVHTV